MNLWGHLSPKFPTQNYRFLPYPLINFQGRNLCNFWLEFWEKRWPHEFILNLIDLYKWKIFFDKFTPCLLFGSFIFVKSSLLITSMLASPISPLLVGTANTSSSFLQSANWKLQRLLCKSWIKLLDCKLDCMSARSNCAQNFGPETCPTRSGLRLPWGTVHNWH